tara:strand:+ start:135 stop:308 length:174 start_codon:yes stop_codon:yes gene_type:complete
MGRKAMIRSRLQEKKALAIVKGELDVRLNAFGLKIRRLETEVRSLRTKIKRLENKGE